MEKHEALRLGYVYAGGYEHSKELIKEKQKKYKGYKTVICPERYSGYERSAGAVRGKISGYSIYVERKYQIDLEVMQLKRTLSEVDFYKEQLRKEYESKVADFELKVKRNKQRLLELLTQI
jgi:hypothetical protein